MSEALETLAAVKHRSASERGRQMTADERNNRNALIDHLYEIENLSLTEVGDRVGLSRERVRQLRAVRGKAKVASAGVQALYEAYMRIVRDPKTMTKRSATGQARDLPMGYKLDLVLRDYPVPSGAVLTRLFRWRRQAKMARELAALSFKLGRTPSALDITRANHAGFGASVWTYAKIFGSLNAAQARAGLIPNQRGRQLKG